MLGTSLILIYRRMRKAGLTRSKIDFSRRWLGRGKTYLRDFEHRDGREGMRVSPKTVAALRARLRALAGRAPSAIAEEVVTILEGIDRDCRVADALSRQRSHPISDPFSSRSSRSRA